VRRRGPGKASAKGSEFLKGKKGGRADLRMKLQSLQDRQAAHTNPIKKAFLMKPADQKEGRFLKGKSWAAEDYGTEEGGT